MNIIQAKHELQPHGSQFNIETILHILTILDESKLILEKNNIELTNKIDAIYKTMQSGIIIHKAMKILEVNNRMTIITGYSEQELRNMLYDELFIPHESLADSNIHFSKPFVYNSMCFQKSGDKIPVEISMFEYSFDNSSLYISIIRDNREQKAIENELQTERTQRLKAIFDGQEIERKRLAKEIHDGLAQSLVAIRMLIEGKIANSKEIDKEVLEKIRLLIDNAISDARMMSNNLHPSVLLEFGFVTALRQLCDHVRSNSYIQVNFSADCSKFVLNSTQSTYLFRISQEAISNIIKHAKANQIDVTISQTNDELVLTIKDNGIGVQANEQTQQKGNGMHNMKERVKLMHGSFEIASDDSKGTLIRIQIPNWRHL